MQMLLSFRTRFSAIAKKQNTSQSSECITEKIKCGIEDIKGCTKSIDKTAMEGLIR